MKNNERDSYGYCALLIAALGEVREALGEVNGKEQIMNLYKMNIQKEDYSLAN